MKRFMNVLTAVMAVLCVLAFLTLGAAAVVAVVLMAVGVLAWQVAAASRPRPLRLHGRGTGQVPAGGLIGHQRDRRVVRDEGGEGEGVEDLVEAEPRR
ncbi:hypothetical protein GCM10010329_03520 [Streptomyces spiroverticillatus]|uniref:Uncharacterized protein n=1 Tax=Streptomyces finlayi TaxID=67296 RepID=A0A919C735_9ACTN|nr:hypothetical protein GCM10010329_03520 [Streptomyces spiroverticillatus]GHC78348.1 hypothetical protein GCM10010334_03500 [Streptomyces finlayi]